MSDPTEQQGFDLWDVAAVASVLLGCGSIFLVMLLPYRDVGIGFAAAIATVLLAVGAAKFNRSSWTSWFARAGSAAGVVALAMLIIGEITRSQ